MNVGRRPLLAFAAAALAALAGARAARGDPPPPGGAVVVAIGEWHVRSGHIALLVPLADVLTAKQKDIINGGFTTVSQLVLSLPKPGQEDDEDDSQHFYSVRCSVKFDAWEETYDVARLDESPKTGLVKRFADYGEMCLKGEITQQEVLDRLAQGGGTLFGQLVVKQTSVEEAAKIKEWLIQQQSGVMQGLFSHMIGELTLNQTLKVKISVPPKPQTVDAHEGKTTPARPEGEGGKKHRMLKKE